MGSGQALKGSARGFLASLLKPAVHFHPGIASLWSILSAVDIERTMQFVGEHQARDAEQVAKHEQQIRSLPDLRGLLVQDEMRLNMRMGDMESRQQEMRARMTRLFVGMDCFIPGLKGNDHQPR